MSNQSKTARVLSLPAWKTAIQVGGISLLYVVFTWAVLRDSVLA